MLLASVPVFAFHMQLTSAMSVRGAAKAPRTFSILLPLSSRLELFLEIPFHVF
jgi:hypothetical protein